MQTQESKSKLKKEIIAVIAVAAVCLIVAAIFVVQYAVNKYNEEKAVSEFSESFSEKLEESSKKAGELKEALNTELVGTYQFKGEVPEKDATTAIAAMQFLPDGKVNARTYGNEEVNGWWTSSVKNGVEFIAVGFSGRSDIAMYQRQGSYIMDVKSLYYGKLEKTPYFNTTLVCESSTGKMTLNFDDKGVARGEFIDTNEKSENKGVVYSLKGSYSIDGDFVDVTLNGALTRFLMFDYGMDDTDMDSGMASLYFEKID